MTFREASTYLLGAINETVSRRNPGRLERMEAFLRHLGDPHLRYRTIHVGGTSGKGSTATMLATTLTTAGKKVGLHTKPHLSSMTERARIDGCAITEERFAAILTEMFPAIEATMLEHGRPSYYETLLALALTHFAQENVDLAVIEVGVGGALDGTNLIHPEVSIITNVGLDHTDVLGDTLELIARDKAGIAKPGVPLVSAAAPGPRAVIQEACAVAGAPFFAVSDGARVEPRKSEPYGQSFAVTTERGTYELELPVLGSFQQRNAATALVALERLSADLRPSIEVVERAFAQLVIPGRMEFFPGFPSVLFDVAHNPDKAQSLADALAETFPGRRFAFIVAITETKDAAGILRPWFDLPASFIFTSFETAGRTAARPLRLVNIAQLAGVSARAISDPTEALSIARRNADASHIVVVTGSTFVAGLLRDWWFENVGERSRN
ncbi:MAG: bifunctional folylpolyglutamate synthase/dihydrofolate synthase [Vulcanimicrobiaceae bacterium]